MALLVVYGLPYNMSPKAKTSLRMALRQAMTDRNFEITKGSQVNVCFQAETGDDRNPGICIRISGLKPSRDHLASCPHERCLDGITTRCRDVAVEFAKAHWGDCQWVEVEAQTAAKSLSGSSRKQITHQESDA